MRRAEAILAAVLAISTAGCTLRGKAKPPDVPAPAPKPAPAPPPAPPPLSTPQTHVTLPPEQPIDPDALPVLQPQKPAPQTAPRAAAPEETRTRPPRSRSEPPPAQTTPPAQTAPPEPERPPIQEVVPLEQQREFKDKADNSKGAARSLLDKAKARRLSSEEQDLVKQIENFVRLSDDAAGRGNMRQAYELADRALILARELQSGR